MHIQFICGRLSNDAKASQSGKAMMFNVVASNWKDKDDKKEFGGSERFYCMMPNPNATEWASDKKKGMLFVGFARKVSEEYNGEKRETYIVENGGFYHTCSKDDWEMINSAG